jgi:putative ATP-binding cassette transporter
MDEAAAENEEAAHSGLVPQLAMMIGALLTSPVRNTLFVIAALLVLVVVGTAYGQIRLNSWNQPFYDALAHRDFRQFLAQLGVFALLSGALLVLNVAQRWLAETLKLRLREGLVHDLVQNWLMPRRAFRLANAGPIGVNPDQRLHEDARHLTELSADLGIGLLQSSVLFVIFAKVLWGLSSSFALRLGGHTIDIPGYMVWAAIVYAGSASLLSYWVGRNLVSRNSERYAREAELRFSLVRVNEHIDAIALAGGESDEARHILRDLDAVLAATRRIVMGLTNLTWITAGYGWFTLVAPILAAAPLYFRGSFSFGGLMMAAGAFTQAQSSLRWFVDNFSTIADWRATLLRVASFRGAAIGTDSLHHAENRIGFSDGGQSDHFTIDDLEIASPAGCTMLQEKHVVVHPGERVWIVGEPGTGKTLLFRALAGLWPWGAGNVTRPQGVRILYMPRAPYLPPGSLREVLAYPGKAEDFREQDFTRALARLGLDHLAPLLDSTRRWDQELSEDIQRSLIFARVVLHGPRWLLIDEVLDSLDSAALARVTDLLATDLKETAVVHIGNPPPQNRKDARIVHLVRDPGVRQLPPRRTARRATAGNAAGAAPSRGDRRRGGTRR